MNQEKKNNLNDKSDLKESEKHKEVRETGTKETSEKKSEQDLTNILEEKEKLLKEKEDQYLRLRADFENYKKRVASEREEIVSFANEMLISSLLPVLDNFERAINAINNLNNLDKNLEEILKGIALVHRHMLDTFYKLGLEEIPAQGKTFDPLFHEAALDKKVPGQAAGVIVEVLQKGYIFKGKVIRPAMVVVAK